MPNRWAVQNGNWSNTATWNNGAVLLLPTASDVVFTNGFNVTVNQNIIVTQLRNTATSSATATVALDRVVVVPAISVGANSISTIDLKQVIPANATPKTITGFASTTSVNFHISGVEIV
jgi:hypothetical protein